MPNVEFSLIVNTEKIMKKVHFTDSQILAILKQAESGVPMPELWREHGMGTQPFINGAQNMAAWMRL